MVEVAVVCAILLVAVAVGERRRRAGLRRARAAAERMLDDLAAAACARMADGEGPIRSRRAAWALERYGRTRDQVAAASTRRELERIIRRHRMRTRSVELIAEVAAALRRPA